MSTGQSSNRAAVRRLQHNPDPKRPDGKRKFEGQHVSFGGKPGFTGQPIYFPKRKKLKGYQKTL